MPINTGFIVPQVFLREIDLTLAAKYFQTSIGGAILISRQGTLEDNYVTRVEDFDAEYGRPDPTWSFGHYCLRKFLTKGQGAWVKRVQRNARHAGSIIFNDRTGSQGSQTYFKPFTTGRFENYKNGSQQLLNFKFSKELTTGQTVTFEFANNPDFDDLTTVSQVFTESNDKTLDLLTKAIQTAMNNDMAIVGKNAGQAFVNKVGSSNTNDRLITIVAPEDVNIYFDSDGVLVTGTGSPATVTMYEDSIIGEVYAENPGAWAGKNLRGIGYRFVGANNGINQRIGVNFDRPVAENQAIQARIRYINSVTNAVVDESLVPTPFDTDHKTTVIAFMGKIKTLLGNASDVFLPDDNPSGLTFTVVSPSDGPNTIEFVAVEVVNTSGNAVLPVINTIEIMQGFNSDQTVTFEVYSRDNINIPLEQRVVSFVNQVDGDGNQLFIEDVINEGSTKSDYVRFKYNAENAAGILNIPPEGTPIYWLGGGDDGVLPTTGDVVIAWDAFKSRQLRPMRILINCGLTAVAVQQKMVNIAKKRFDCIAILDNPSNKQQYQDAYTNRMTNHNIDGSYSAFYSPDVKELDEFRNTNLFVPPSGHVAAQFAETDEVAAEWFAPAGLNRGVLDTALGLREEYDEDQMALLISAQINPIINRNGVIVVWDQITTQRKNSAFKNVSLRRLLITVEVGIVDGLDYTIHEPNDSYTAMVIIQICVSILQPIKEGRGLYNFAAVSDERNNKDYDYNNQQRNVDVIMDPILPIRTVRLSAVVTKKGADFAEVVNTINGGSQSLGA